jgi:hypothetical protein
MAQKKPTPKKPGPRKKPSAKTLKLGGDWQQNVVTALRKKKPSHGWPKAQQAAQGESVPNRKRAVQELAEDYLQQPHVEKVIWFPSGDEKAVRLLIVLADGTRDPIRLAVRHRGFYCPTVTVPLSELENTLAGTYDVGKDWDMDDHQVFERPSE